MALSLLSGWGVLEMALSLLSGWGV